MTKKYILENEVQKAYKAEEANEYFLNGRKGKASKIEETVRNGTVVITLDQTKNILCYLSSSTLEDACKKIASELRVDYKDSPKVIKTLERNKLVTYKRAERKCALTKRGATLRNGRMRELKLNKRAGK